MARNTIRVQDLTKVTTLDNGDIIPIGPKSGDVAKGITFENFQNKFSNFIVPISVNSGRVVENSDSNRFFIFNDAGTATLNVPDGLEIGVNFAYTNIGVGIVQLILTGSETLRGAVIVTDPDGYAAASKITATIWQTSER